MFVFWFLVKAERIMGLLGADKAFMEDLFFLERYRIDLTFINKRTCINLV